jgi:hopanoid biosynthesis associated radical SAM protein HpnH
MPMPLRQSLRVGSYLMRQKLARRDKFPLLVELEPLFACNLKCAGCGKIQQPHTLLKQRMPVEQAIAAIEECGAPMVSIAGGEPLMHPQIDEIVRELIKRKKFVFLCTNALLIPKKLDKFRPSPYFAWVVHIDGLRDRHDESVCKEGVFDQAVEAIKECKRRGFTVNTNTTFFNTDTPQAVIDVLNYLNDDLGIDQMQISPAYAYEKAPDQDHFLGVTETRELFRKAFGGGNRKRWRLNHTPLFLDFLEGKTDYACTAWARLAAAVLPDGRRLRQDLQGADRYHRLGEVRARPGPAVRELHGALRLRAVRRAGHGGVAPGVDPRDARVTPAPPGYADGYGFAASAWLRAASSRSAAERSSSAWISSGSVMCTSRSKESAEMSSMMAIRSRAIGSTSRGVRACVVRRTSGTRMRHTLPSRSTSA